MLKMILDLLSEVRSRDEDDDPRSRGKRLCSSAHGSV